MTGVTGKQMCELISEFWRETNGVDVEPEQIWNYSRTGELTMVFVWYEEAKVWQQKRAQVVDLPGGVCDRCLEL